MKKIILTDNAPKPIGPYSQAIAIDKTVYLSGQIPIDPETGVLVHENIAKQIHQVFLNLQAVCEEAGANLNDVVKLTIYLIDLNDFSTLNEILSQFFKAPYPARTTIQVSALPKGARVEIDAILIQ
jgi:reactive intermediate/imine deaminase